MQMEKIIAFLKNQKFLKFFIGLLLSLYLVIMLILYCNTQALVPDETLFLGVAGDIHDKNIFTVKNYLGYGSIYWIFLSLIKNVLALRLIAFGCMMLVPVIIIYIQRKWLNMTLQGIALSCLLYFSMPCVWFTGKIIGPEIYSNTLGILGCFVALSAFFTKFRCKTLLFLLSGILIGISSGIKLYNMAFGVFVLSYIISDFLTKKQNPNIIQSLLSLFTGGITGVLIATPIIITSFSTFIGNLKEYSSPFSIKFMSTVLFRKSIEWDLLNSGGLEHFIIRFIPLLIIFAAGIICNKNKNIVYASIIAVLFLFVLCMRERFLGWYLMPLIFFIPLCIAAESNYNHIGRKRMYVCMYVCMYV